MGGVNMVGEVSRVGGVKSVEVGYMGGVNMVGGV